MKCPSHVVSGMFRGRYEHTVDTKGRLSIPAKYREVLLGKGDERLIITNFVVSSKRCLDVYPLDEWWPGGGTQEGSTPAWCGFFRLLLGGATDGVDRTEASSSPRYVIRRVKRDVMRYGGERFVSDMTLDRCSRR